MSEIRIFSLSIASAYRLKMEIFIHSLGLVVTFLDEGDLFPDFKAYFYNTDEETHQKILDYYFDLDLID